MLGDSVTKDAKLYNMEKPIYAKIEGMDQKEEEKIEQLQYLLN